MPLKTTCSFYLKDYGNNILPTNNAITPKAARVIIKIVLSCLEGLYFLLQNHRNVLEKIANEKRSNADKFFDISKIKELFPSRKIYIIFRF